MARKNMQKSQKNMLIWLVFSLIFVILLIVIVTTAYFSNQKNSSGTITLGELDFTLFENNLSFQNVVPTDTIAKIITISNSRDTNGNNTQNLCSILFRFQFSAEAKSQDELFLQSLDDLVYLKQNSSYTFCDNYYYYNGVLNPSQQVNLCDSLTFSNIIGNEFQDKDISLMFNVEAIQAENEAYKELWLDAPEEWLAIMEQIM